MSHGHDKSSNPILKSGFLRGNIISQTAIGLSVRFRYLLAKMVKYHSLLLSPLISKNTNIISNTHCWKKSNHSFCYEKILRHDSFEKFQCVIMKYLCLATHFFISKYFRIFSFQFPCGEKGCPIKIVC